MAGTTAATTQQIETRTMSRLCWVLNHDSQPYKAEFQGMNIVIPAFNEKIAKHVRDGGNLMEYLAACKFRSDYKQPQSFTQKGEPIFGLKCLRVEELSDEEREKIEGKTAKDIAKEVLTEEKKIRAKIKKETAKNPNKILVASEEEEA